MLYEVITLAIGHCMGAATLAMSMLAGRLRGGLSGVVLSQVPPFIIGGDYSQFRRQLAAFLRDVVGVQEVNLAADEGASAWESVIVITSYSIHYTKLYDKGSSR